MHIDFFKSFYSLDKHYEYPINPIARDLLASIAIGIPLA